MYHQGGGGILNILSYESYYWLEFIWYSQDEICTNGGYNKLGEF